MTETHDDVENLLEELRSIEVEEGGAIVSPSGEEVPLSEIIREIEERTEKGLRFIELDRAAQERLKNLERE